MRLSNQFSLWAWTLLHDVVVVVHHEVHRAISSSRLRLPCFSSASKDGLVDLSDRTGVAAARWRAASTIFGRFQLHGCSLARPVAAGKMMSAAIGWDDGDMLMSLKIQRRTTTSAPASVALTYSPDRAGFVDAALERIRIAVDACFPDARGIAARLRTAGQELLSLRPAGDARSEMFVAPTGSGDGRRAHCGSPWPSATRGRRPPAAC